MFNEVLFAIYERELNYTQHSIFSQNVLFCFKLARKEETTLLTYSNLFFTKYECFKTILGLPVRDYNVVFMILLETNCVGGNPLIMNITKMSLKC